MLCPSFLFHCLFFFWGDALCCSPFLLIGFWIIGFQLSAFTEARLLFVVEPASESMFGSFLGKEDNGLNEEDICHTVQFCADKTNIESLIIIYSSHLSTASRETFAGSR